MDTLDMSQLALNVSSDGRTFDGAWWPRSRTLSEELVRLFAAWPEGAGVISRVYVSSRDWDDLPDTVVVPRRRGRVKIATLPPETVGHLVLIMLGGQRHTLSVIPPDATAETAARSLDAFAVRRRQAQAGPGPSVDA